MARGGPSLTAGPSSVLASERPLPMLVEPDGAYNPSELISNCGLDVST